METTTELLTEGEVEFEEVQLTEGEEGQSSMMADSIPISIDYNNRILSKELYPDSQFTDNCDTQFCENPKYNNLKSDPQELTSSEEYELSDEDESYFAPVRLRKVDLEGIASVSGNPHLEASSSFDHSTTTFKEECFTDAEYVSEDELDTEKTKNQSSLNCNEEKNSRKISFGLSVGDMVSTVKDVFSSKQTTLSSINITNPFATSIGIKNKNSRRDSQDALMTCLEFLKSDPSEDELTDVEDFSTDLTENKSYSMCDLEEAIRYRGKSANAKNGRKNSWTMEVLSEDDLSTGVETSNENNTYSHKRNKRKSVDSSAQPLTDEEFVEVDGDGSALDGEDFRTTTTTRIVTTVSSDQGEDDQQESGSEDLRHSVEVILNQFMSDGDSSKQEDGHSGQEE